MLNTKWNTNTINLIYAISFLDLFAVGLTFPLLSTHLRELGASHTVIGLLSSTYSGIQFFSGPIVGGWSDVRDRKSVLKMTLLMCGACYGLLGTTDSIFFIFIIRFILGIIKHTQSICKAVITDLVPLSEQTGVFGRSAAFGSVGFIIGPFIGGHLSEVKHGFTYVCGLTTASFLINFCLSCLLPEDTNNNKSKTTQNNRSMMGHIKADLTKTVVELKSIDWATHWDTFLLRFFLGLTLTCYFSNQAVYLKEKYELSQLHIGYIISFFSTVGMLSAFFLKRINSFYTTDPSYFIRLSHFFGIITICFFGIYISSSFWVFLILLIPFSLAATTLRVVTMELMFKKSEKMHIGSLSGASSSIMSVARFIAPFLTGIVSDIFSEESVMLVAMIPTILGVGVSLYMKQFVQIHVKNK